MAEASKDEKTEDATPKKKHEARMEGNVAMSQEMLAAVMLAMMAVTMMFGGGELARVTMGQVSRSASTLGELGTQTLTLNDWAAYCEGRIMAILPALAIVVLPVIAVGALTGYLQIGFKIASKAVGFKPNKLNPITGFGKVFNKQNAVKTLLAGAKILLVITAVGLVAWSQLGNMNTLAGTDVGPMMQGVGYLLLRCVAAGVLVVIFLSIFDLLYQRHHHAESLKMTKQEVKDEHKSTEGDPHIKAKIRGVQREVAMRRMMEDVPDATVVVTNPTHYAVAIRYDRTSESAAPRIVAKGVDQVAQNIKKVARANDVPCYEDRPLARALHARTEIGDEIPEDLFQAVAQVLAYVYRLKGETVTA